MTQSAADFTQLGHGLFRYFVVLFKSGDWSSENSQPLGQLIARLLLRNHPISAHRHNFLTGIRLTLFGSLLQSFTATKSWASSLPSSVVFGRPINSSHTCHLRPIFRRGPSSLGKTYVRGFRGCLSCSSGG